MFQCHIKVGKCGSASFSECGTYRYMLMRVWHESPERFINWIMLNPSTATEDANDPTISRCISFTKSWGYDGLYITNIFALRSTDPKALYDHKDPVGPENDAHLKEWADQSSHVVAAWGAHGNFKNRGGVVKELIEKIPANLYVLKINNDGTPSHPLYLSGKLMPKKWST